MPVATYEHPAWQAVADQAMRPGGLAVTRQALALCELPPGARLLDVGCGAGATLHYLGAECRLARLGVDASLKLLRRARQNDLVLPLAQARGEHLPFAGETIDVLLSECTLSIFDTGQALAEWGRVLKRGGHLMVSDVYVRNPEGVAALRQLPPGSCIREAMPQAQIIEYIERRGCKLPRGRIVRRR